MANAIELVTGTLGSVIRGFAGTNVEEATIRPEQMLKLYDIEASPYCRLVREALTELDLDAEIYPCPRDGRRFRREVLRLGGKEQFPFLVDPNTGRQMYESEAIVEYLYETYGRREVPSRWRRPALQKAASLLASLPRALQGSRARRDRLAVQPGQTASDAPTLELYSYEASPYAKPVRETLCELEVPYILRNCGRNRLGEWIPPVLRERLGLIADSTLHNRVALQQLEGKVGIPYLRDPSTATGLFESGQIVGYLEGQYAAG